MRKSIISFLLFFTIIQLPIGSSYLFGRQIQAQLNPILTPMEAANKFLNIPADSVSEEFSVFKKAPFLENTIIYVILTIKEIGDGYQIFNSNILFVENNNNLLYLLKENHSIYTDALRLTEVAIDTAPYMVKKDSRAFGVRLSYTGSSRVNPFNKATINLYEIASEELVNILNEFVVNHGSGENNGWDTGAWNTQESILVIDTIQSNEYYNIIVKSKERVYAYSDEKESESISEYKTRGYLRFDSDLKKYIFSDSNK